MAFRFLHTEQAHRLSLNATEELGCLDRKEVHKQVKFQAKDFSNIRLRSRVDVHGLSGLPRVFSLYQCLSVFIRGGPLVAGMRLLTASWQTSFDRRMTTGSQPRRHQAVVVGPFFRKVVGCGIERCWFIDADRLRDGGHNPVGVGNDTAISQGSRVRQPWAGGCNPLRG